MVASIVGISAAGAIGGAFLAYTAEPRRSTLVPAAGYGFGFLLGGSISATVLLVYLEMGHETTFKFVEFYFLFIVGFCIAGATSAALIRPRLVSVANSTICFLVASAVGGVVVGILFGSPMSEPLITAIGLLVTYTVGGAISGAVLEMGLVNEEESDHTP